MQQLNIMVFFIYSLIFIVVRVHASVWGTTASPNPPKASNFSFFREDYNFHPDARGWLKLHKFPATWDEARLICHLEGAVLASPLHDGLVSAMTAEFNPYIRGCFTGLRAQADFNYFFSLEGIPLAKMSAKWTPEELSSFDNEKQCISIDRGMISVVSCNARLPYFCYKEMTSVLENKCGSNGYHQYEKSGSCYKFHSECRTWKRSLAICAAEGGSLTIINSESEAKVIQRLLQENVTDISCEKNEYAFVGFYNWATDPNECYWSTLDDKTLEEAGFTKWAGDKPKHTFGKNCGTTMLVGDSVALGNENCDELLPFICELQPLLHK